jgi:hypothetical protein
MSSGQKHEPLPDAASHRMKQERQEPMSIKTGNIVSHAGAMQWGAGKVMEVSPSMVTIRFSDGKDRKIASSHFSTLRPADATLYVAPPAAAPLAQARPVARKTKKVK